MKLEKQLAKLHLDSVTISKVLDVLKVVIAQPGGTFLIGWLAIDGLERIGYFGTTSSSLTPSQQQAAGAAQSFISGIAKSLPPGLAQVFQLRRIPGDINS